MVPADLHDFLIACVGASATFVGLLFVALSVITPKSNRSLADRDRLLAESSFSGLINVFFVTLVGLLPRASIGYVSFVMAALGLLSCWRLRRSSQTTALVISALIYLLEAGFGLSLLLHSRETLSLGLFQTVIFSLFTISLVRAWGLTGLHREASD